MDNGLKIKNITDTHRQYKLAKKYLPVYKIFINRIKQDDIVLPEREKHLITDEMCRAELIATEIVANKWKD